MKLSPGDFLGFTTSTIFIVIICGLFLNALHVLSAVVLFWLAMAVIVPCVPVPATFLWLKLWAMFRVDTSGAKKQVTRRKAS